MEKLNELRKQLLTKSYENNYDKFLIEIEIQEILHGTSAKLDIIKTFRKQCKTEMQFYSFVQIRWDKYGTKSYNCDAFYIPTNELINIAVCFQPNTNQKLS